MKYYAVLILLTSLSSVVSFAGEGERIWMSQKGTMIRATWDGKLTEGKKISLTKSDGRVVSINLKALSLVDQHYITEQLRRPVATTPSSRIITSPLGSESRMAVGKDVQGERVLELESQDAGIAPKGGVVLEGLCGLKLGVVQKLDMIDVDRSSDTYYVHPPCPLKGFDTYGVRYTPKGKIVSSITARKNASNSELRLCVGEIIETIEEKYGAKMKVERRYNSDGRLRDLDATLVFEPDGERGRRSISVACVCGDPKYGDSKGALFVTAKDELVTKQRSVELRSTEEEQRRKAL